MNDLVDIISDGEALVKRATEERDANLFTYDKETDRFTMTNGDELLAEAQDLYVRYATWLENFSLSN